MLKKKTKRVKQTYTCTLFMLIYVLTQKSSNKLDKNTCANQGD